MDGFLQHQEATHPAGVVAVPPRQRPAVGFAGVDDISAARAGGAAVTDRRIDDAGVALRALQRSDAAEIAEMNIRNHAAFLSNLATEGRVRDAPLARRVRIGR